MEMTKNEAVIGAKATKAATASAASGAAIEGEASLRLREACQRVLTFPGKALSGLAVILLRDGRIVWEDYFGMRRFAGTAANATGASGTLGDGVDLPVDAETRWRVASISKPTATLGAMRLVEKGLLDLDRDISAYMGYPLNNPWFPAKAITARMLLGHSSSLRDAGFYYPPLGHSLRDLFVPQGRYYDAGSHFALPDPATDKSPGSFYSYCNLGFAILGSIIERLSGERFDEYMKKAVFDPLGIDGGFNPNLLSDRGFHNLSPIYRKCLPDNEHWDCDGPWHPQIDNYGDARPKLPVRVPSEPGEQPSLEDYRLGENGSLFSPQGGMRIRARDLAKIAQLFIDGGEVDDGFGLDGQARTKTRILSEPSVRAMMRPGWERNETGSNCEEEFSRVYSTGIGLMRPTGPGGGPAWWGHRGNAYGFLGGMFVNPAKRSGYVYMIGGTGANPDKNRDGFSGLSVWEEALGCAIEKALSST